MGTDTVDDLHAAEDYGETLRVKAQAAVDAFDAWERNSDTTAKKYEGMQKAITDLELASAQRFERPGCETEDESHGTDAACIQGDDCGGYHSWQHEEGE